jgi:hypothetical protein
MVIYPWESAGLVVVVVIVVFDVVLVARGQNLDLITRILGTLLLQQLKLLGNSEKKIAARWIATTCIPASPLWKGVTALPAAVFRAVTSFETVQFPLKIQHLLQLSSATPSGRRGNPRRPLAGHDGQASLRIVFALPR